MHIEKRLQQVCVACAKKHLLEVDRYTDTSSSFNHHITTVYNVKKKKDYNWTVMSLYLENKLGNQLCCVVLKSREKIIYCYYL